MYYISRTRSWAKPTIWLPIPPIDLITIHTGAQLHGEPRGICSPSLITFCPEVVSIYLRVGSRDRGMCLRSRGVCVLCDYSCTHGMCAMGTSRQRPIHAYIQWSRTRGGEVRCRRGFPPRLSGLTQEHPYTSYTDDGPGGPLMGPAGALRRAPRGVTWCIWAARPRRSGLSFQERRTAGVQNVPRTRSKPQRSERSGTAGATGSGQRPAPVPYRQGAP